MRARPRTWTLLGGLIFVAAGACEGDDPAAVTTDGGRPTAGNQDGGSSLNRDGGAFVSDAMFRSRPDRPPPSVSPMAKRIVPGRAQLLGLHRSGCSHESPASTPDGARWCAFSLPGRQLGRLELWVINITKATAGDVKCDGSSPDCLKLTENLFGGRPEAGPAYPTAHRFYGDTLIFYANARSSPTALYKGPVYAWRPGWSAEKQISGDEGVLCSGHSRAQVAVCIENITPEDRDPVEWDLTAGRLADAPFKKVARITPVRANGATQWRSGFTLAGDYFAYSTGGARTSDRETLHVMKTEDIGDMGKYIAVGAPGIARWTISADGKKWYYLRNYNYSIDGNPSGTLSMADFPSGDNETTVAGRVGVFQALSDDDEKEQGIAYLDAVSEGRGNFKILKDPAKGDDPANVVEVARNIASVPVFSPDLRYSYFAKEFDEDIGTSDAHVAKSDGSGSCVLSNSLTATIFGYPFLRSSGIMFFVDNVDLETDSGEGWHADPATCRKSRFSNNIDFWFVYRDEGIVYSDGSDGEVVTLRYAQVADGKTWPANGPIEVQRQAERIFVVLPNFEGVLFNLSTGVESLDGFYHQPLPFGTTAAPADGGVADAAMPDSSAPTPDVGTSPEAATPPDAGTTPDAGSPADAGTDAM
jgi:hypothetical protein